MNRKVLKQAEKAFLKRYPGGFRHPEMEKIKKKHKGDQLNALAREQFAKAAFSDPEAITQGITKLVSRSTLVSMFEKPKFRRLMDSLGPADTERCADILGALLHGKEKGGFEAWVDFLGEAGLAKWTLATVVQSHFRPTKDVFVKPTTAKLIIDKLELDMRYDAKPTWAFYRQFRKTLGELKTQVSEDLSPSNAAFSGFLMVSLGDDG